MDHQQQPPKHRVYQITTMWARNPKKLYLVLPKIDVQQLREAVAATESGLMMNEKQIKTIFRDIGYLAADDGTDDEHVLKYYLNLSDPSK